MVSIKLLALLAVVAIVAGSPHHKAIKKKVPYAWTVSSSGSSGVTAGASAAGNAGANAVAFSSLRFLAKGIADRNSLSYKAFKWIGGRTAVSSVNDALDIVLTAAAGVGGLINLWIPGLGSLFSSLVIASARISYCVVGQPSSSHFGLVRDGKANINICANGNYGAKWGWKAYSGDYSNAALVIKAYGLENASAKVNQFLAAKGGLQALDGYEKKIASAIVVVAKLFDRDVKTWSSQDVNTVFAKSTEVLGWLANSYYPRLGGYVLADFLRLGSNKNVVNVGLGRPQLNIGLPLRSAQIPVGGDLHPASMATFIRSSVHLVGGRPTLRLLVRGPALLDPIGHLLCEQYGLPIAT